MNDNDLDTMSRFVKFLSELQASEALAVVEELAPKVAGEHNDS